MTGALCLFNSEIAGFGYNLLRGPARHFEPYSGAPLAAAGYANYSVAASATQQGTTVHQGREFRRLNALSMVASCLANRAAGRQFLDHVMEASPHWNVGSASATARWQRLTGAVAIAAVLGLVFPLLGGLILMALAIDRLWPRRSRQRLGLSVLCLPTVFRTGATRDLPSLPPLSLCFQPHHLGRTAVTGQ